MSELVGVVLTLVIVGFIADINSGAIVGGLLAARTGKREGLSFLAGMTSARLIQWIVGASAVTAVLSQFFGGIKLDRFTWFLLGVAGLAVMLVGLQAALKPHVESDAKKSEDEGGVTSKASFITGFAINIVSLRQWIFTSLAVAAIGTLRPGWPLGIGLTVFYMLVSSWMVVGLLVLRMTRPKQALGLIDRLAAWADANLGRIVAWMGTVLGALLLGVSAWKLFG